MLSHFNSLVPFKRLASRGRRTAFGIQPQAPSLDLTTTRRGYNTILTLGRKLSRKGSLWSGYLSLIVDRTITEALQTGNLFPARLREAHQDKRQNTNFRRNGKLQACEPCRRGKLRCDHMMPTCGRCAKRGKPDQCLYHPAPLTKASTSHKANSEKSSPRLNSFSIAYQSPSDLATGIPDGRHVAKRARTLNPSEAPTLLDAASYGADPPNYTTFEGLGKILSGGCVRPDAFDYDNKAGLLSHSAVLAEHELSIGINMQPSGGASTSAAKVSQRYIEQGAAVLTLFKDFSAMQKYIEK